DATVLHALVLAAQALVVLHRPEDGGAEQAVALGLEGAVVDGLGLLDFAERPRTDQVGRGQRDLDRVEVERRALLVEQVQKVFHVFLRERESRTWLRCSPEAGAWCAPCPGLRPQFSSSSMLIASERISLTSTLKDSGMPATSSYAVFC